MTENFAAAFTDRQKGHLPGLLNIEWDLVAQGEARGRFAVAKDHMAPNGFLHAASVIALADSAAGYGCSVSRPEGSSGFTTIELKSNFLGSAREGVVSCRAWLVHGGRNTQVWDAEVRHEETSKTIALFRCTQMILWPKGQA